MGREATLVTALYYCCKCDVNLSNQCSLTPLRRVAGGGVAVARVVRSQDGRYDRYTAEAAPPGPGRRSSHQQTPVSQLLSSPHRHHETPAVATLQQPNHDGRGLGRPPPPVPARAAPPRPRPRPRPRDQRRPRQEEEDRGQVPRAGGDAREAGVGCLVTNTLTRAFTLQLRK